MFDPSTNRLSVELVVEQFDYIFTASSCINKFESKDVRAAGDWSDLPIWNAFEPKGKMTFDETNCLYHLSN